MEESVSEARSAFSTQLQAIVEDTAASVSAAQELSSTVAENSRRMSTVEQSLSTVTEDVKEALRLVDIQRRVKEETTSTLITLVDKSLADLREKLLAEVATRERNESAVLSILEGMSGVDD